MLPSVRKDVKSSFMREKKSGQLQQSREILKTAWKRLRPLAINFTQAKL